MLSMGGRMLKQKAPEVFSPPASLLRKCPLGTDPSCPLLGVTVPGSSGCGWWLLSPVALVASGLLAQVSCSAAHAG